MVAAGAAVAAQIAPPPIYDSKPGKTSAPKKPAASDPGSSDDQSETEAVANAEAKGRARAAAESEQAEVKPIGREAGWTVCVFVPRHRCGCRVCVL